MTQNYESLRQELSELPMTWYPDLIRAMIEAAIKKKVFLKGGATRFVRDVEKKIWTELSKSPATCTASTVIRSEERRGMESRSLIGQRFGPIPRKRSK